MNTTGKLFTFTSFGESHGKGIGGIIDGCPAGIELDETFIQNELSRRRPGQSIISTPRSEEDNVEFLSGIFEGKTTGTPIAFVIWNKNQESKILNTERLTEMLEGCSSAKEIISEKTTNNLSRINLPAKSASIFELK